MQDERAPNIQYMTFRAAYSCLEIAVLLQAAAVTGRAAAWRAPRTENGVALSVATFDLSCVFRHEPRRSSALCLELHTAAVAIAQPFSPFLALGHCETWQRQIITIETVKVPV